MVRVAALIMASSHALAKGTSYPPLAPGVLRFYNMRFCPFAQRTRLVLVHKNIPHETVNVNLKYKPDWFLQRAPRGLVPVLEQDDKVVYESMICNEYLEERYPEPALMPTDPYERAQARLLMDDYNKAVTAFYGLKSRKMEKKVESYQKLVEYLAYFEEKLTGTFFGGSSPNLVDYYIWPWIERLPAMQSIYDLNPLENCPKLQLDMLQTRAVRETAMPTDLHVQFLQSFATGYPSYDAGLPAKL